MRIEIGFVLDHCYPEPIIGFKENVPVDDNFGIIYIVTNASMPDFIKIGFTQADDVAVRVRSLDNTSVPLPFELHYAAKVANYRKVERTLHEAFDDYRTRSNREFFNRLDPEKPAAILRMIAIEEISISDDQLGIEPIEREDIVQARKKATRRYLHEAKLEVGTELVLNNHDHVRCRIHDNQQVEYDGEIMSLSASALEALAITGRNWVSANGFDHWTYDGETIGDRIKRFDNEDSSDLDS